MFKVIHHQQQLFLTEELNNLLGQGGAVVKGNVQCLTDRRGNQVRFRQRRQRDEKHPMDKMFDRLGRHLQRHAGLPRSSRTDQSQQPAGGRPQLGANGSQISRPADKGCALRRQIVGMSR